MPGYLLSRARPALARRSRLIWSGLAAGYLVATTAFLVTHGSWPTPDFLIPPLVLLAVANGRGWQFVIDWSPFLLLMLGYEAFRGVADNLNSRVHFVSLIDADKWLLGGETGPNLLQRLFFREDRVAWYDWVASVLHMIHFVVPVAAAFAIWLVSRRTYWRFAVTVLGLFFMGFVTYYAYPAAPPWMAGDFGLIPHVERVLIHTLVQLPATKGISLAYEHFSPNPVAAMPSLHAALPMLVSFVAISLAGRKAMLTLAYPIAGGFSWIYLGEHYVIDVLAGWLYALLAFAVFWMALPALVRRAAAPVAARFEAPRLAWPAWPLTTLAVGFMALVWVNPLVQAPLNPDRGALIPSAGFRIGIATAVALSDLEPLPCREGRAASLLLDRELDPLVRDYAAYIQGLSAPVCLSLTAGRGAPELTDEDLDSLRSLSTGPSPRLLFFSGPPLLAIVQIGYPTAELQAIAGVAPDDRLALIVRFDNAQGVALLYPIVARIATLAFTYGELTPPAGESECVDACTPEPPRPGPVQEAAPTPPPEETPGQETQETATPTPDEATPTPTPTPTATPTTTPTPGVEEGPG
ncbi:MAG TPA: phosphatase PAP2 family protein [Dehalococcoidia bacterium]|nr:phosphatase PAP2 family protein [Dehalococcoidia bacterium]